MGRLGLLVALWEEEGGQPWWPDREGGDPQGNRGHQRPETLLFWFNREGKNKKSNIGLVNTYESQENMCLGICRG
jgi:hypothetical protein